MVYTLYTAKVWDGKILQVERRTPVTSILVTCGFISLWVPIVNHSEIWLIDEMSNKGIMNQAFSSDTGQMPMTVQPNGQTQGNDQRAAENAHQLFGCNTPGYLESCCLAFLGWLFCHGPGYSAYRIAQRLKETKPCLKERLNFWILYEIPEHSLAKFIQCEGSYIYFLKLLKYLLPMIIIWVMWIICVIAYIVIYKTASTGTTNFQNSILQYGGSGFSMDNA